MHPSRTDCSPHDRPSVDDLLAGLQNNNQEDVDLVPAAVVGAVTAAMVLASPMNTGTEAEPAVAPNPAEILAVADCGEMALTTVSGQTGWHNAVGSKRVSDRTLVLARDGAAGSCKGPGQANRLLP